MLSIWTSLKLCCLVKANVVKTFNSQSQLLLTLRKKAFENFVGKGENAITQQFSFPMKDNYYFE